MLNPDSNPLPSFYDLLITEVPWKIFPDGDGGLTKILAHWGPISQYKRGTYLSPFRDEQNGLVTSPESGIYVIDIDYPGLIPPDFPFDLEACRQTTGREGGLQLFVDASELDPADFPRQGGYDWGDVKSNGFVPMPRSVHPNGKIYTLIDGPVQRATPAMSRWLEENRPSKGGGTSADRGPNDPGAGRNNELCGLKGYYIGLGYSEADANAEVLKANALYSVPLDERELQATVLRPKPGWKTASDLGISHSGDDEVLDPLEEHGENEPDPEYQRRSARARVRNSQVSRWIGGIVRLDFGPRCPNAYRMKILLLARALADDGGRRIAKSAADLAEQLGFSRHFVSRALRRLADLGFIRHGWGWVELLLPKVSRRRLSKRGELVPLLEAFEPVQGALEYLVAEGPERISQREISKKAEERIQAVHPEWRNSAYRTRQVLKIFREWGLWSRTSPHKPEREADGWRALPAEWAEGKHDEKPDRPRSGPRKLIHGCVRTAGELDIEPECVA